MTLAVNHFIVGDNTYYNLGTRSLTVLRQERQEISTGPSIHEMEARGELKMGVIVELGNQESGGGSTALGISW